MFIKLLKNYKDKTQEQKELQLIIDELKQLAAETNYSTEELLHPVRNALDLPIKTVKSQETESDFVVMNIVKDRNKKNNKLDVNEPLKSEDFPGFKEGTLYRLNKWTGKYEQYNPETEQFEPINKEEE
jgi:hypothetical protein